MAGSTIVPNEFDVTERIEGHAIEAPCRVIAELVCYKAMRGLMRGDGDHRGDGKCRDVQRIVERDVHVYCEASGGKQGFNATVRACQIKIGIGLR